MQVIGKDKEGHLIAAERGLLATTLYRTREGGLAGLGDLGFDWETLGSIINSNPIVQGLGRKIGGQQGAYPIAQYSGTAPGTVPAFSSTGTFSINPMYVLIGAGLILVFALKR